MKKKNTKLNVLLIMIGGVILMILVSFLGRGARSTDKSENNVLEASSETSRIFFYSR